jgi:hydroxymethylpyrimidine/phosphomethylpyrimidine kinase
VITAVTAQNLAGVYAIQPIDPGIVQKQLTAVLDGFPIKAIKTGMLFSAEIIDAISQTLALSKYRGIPLVMDPVFCSTSGSKLIRDDAIEKLVEKLFPMAALITPNIPEAEVLLGTIINNRKELEEAAKKLFQRFGVPVLMKGGHLTGIGSASDVLVDSEGMDVFEAESIEGVNTHGSGCTLSAAIAGAMARGESLRQAVRTAKAYITQAIKHGLLLSPDVRVINHAARGPA